METAKYRGDYKGGTIAITRRVKQDKTRNFAVKDILKELGNGNPNGPRDNKKVVYETITIPVPSYINVTYSITLRSEYREQMNDLVAPFIAKT